MSNLATFRVPAFFLTSLPQSFSNFTFPSFNVSNMSGTSAGGIYGAAGKSVPTNVEWKQATRPLLLMLRFDFLRFQCFRFSDVVDGVYGLFSIALVDLLAYGPFISEKSFRCVAVAVVVVIHVQSIVP